MLTINSKALKIGNKWLNPVNGSGPTPPSTTYYVTTSGTHGSVTASPTEGTTGTEVTLSNTPDTGYEFDSYTITGTGATLSGNILTIGTSDVSVVGNFVTPATYDSFELELTSNGNGMSFGKVTMTPIAGTWTNPSDTFTVDSTNLTYMTRNITTFSPSAGMIRFNLTFAGGTKPASISWDNSVNSGYTCTGATFYGYINNVKYTLGTLAGYPELLAMTHTITL